MSDVSSELKECLCIDFDTICGEFPGHGERLETMLTDFVGVFHEARAAGYTVVIRSDRADDAGHRRRVTRHLERIGMPFDAILPSRVLGLEPITAECVGPAVRATS